MGEPVGDFYVHLVHGQKVDQEMTSSTKLLSMTGMPSVIHFYDGGCGGCRPCAAQMEIWAKDYANQVQFLCVCVESKGVALMFSHMFGLEHAVNAFIPSRAYMPRGFGQLGCSGFIVVDKKGCFLSRKTPAFLNYGEEAFRQVEELLSHELQMERPVVHHEISTPSVLALSAATPHQHGNKTESPSLVSVGVQSMDQEHERCADALQALSESPNKNNLLQVLKEVEDHFRHEEAIMKEHDFGGDGGPFSAFVSHVKDHERILELGRKELNRLMSSKTASCEAASSSCHVGPQVNQVIDKLVAKDITDAFYLHAERFDALYADRIPALAT